MPTDFDSPWKEALDEFFEPFLALLFPQVHEIIDWSRGYESLDTELQQILRESDQGRKHVDKLMKVWLLDGAEKWLLIHIEVQSQEEAEFPLRMFRYQIRLFERYNQMALSLAVLGDDRPDWRPSRFAAEVGGCSLIFSFPTVKLLDYAGREEELEQSENVFAVIVLAHLQALKTRTNVTERESWKMRLARSLLQRGFEGEPIRRLFKFLDGLLQLPKELDKPLWQEVEAYARENRMPYIPSFERIFKEEGHAIGLAEGRAEGERAGCRKSLHLAIKTNFGRSAEKLLAVVAGFDDVNTLEAALQIVLKSKTASEAQKALAKLR